MRSFSSFVVTSLALTIGCASTGPAPMTATSHDAESSGALTPRQENAIAKAQKEAGQGGLKFDEEVSRLCPGVDSPKFDFDSARMKSAFRDSIVGLARCMNDGGLKGRNLLLVGHADPRGEDDYNLALGGRRAGAVQDALTSLHVGNSRLETSSRGAIDAQGTSEATWAEDRRVDVNLASR